MRQYISYRTDVERLVGAALAAVDPFFVVRQAIRVDGRFVSIGRQKFRLGRGKIFVVAVGKAAGPMAAGASKQLGEHLSQGIVLTKHNFPIANMDGRWQQFTAGHPVSDSAGLYATEAILELVGQATADDVVLCLISGGASALLTKPRLPLAEWQALNQALLASGCTIHQFNTVRKWLDEVKGGGLARAIAPAAGVSLILSDVVGNRLDLIGSGPTVLNPDPPQAAVKVLQSYQLLTPALNQLLQSQKLLPFPPPVPVNYVVADVYQAAQAAVEEAAGMKFASQLLTYHLEGEAREVGRVAAALGKSLAPGAVLVLGGETTVTLNQLVKGGVNNTAGRGGRNTELALAAALALEGQHHVVVAAVATDGDDGNSGAAGAVVTAETVKMARRWSLNPELALQQHDSATFFAQLDQQVEPSQKTLFHLGPTGVNVNDLLFVLKYEI